MPKYWGNQFSATGVFPKWVKSRRRKNEKKVGENNGKLRFIRHHGWATQTRLDQYNYSPALPNMTNVILLLNC